MTFFLSIKINRLCKVVTREEPGLNISRGSIGLSNSTYSPRHVSSIAVMFIHSESSPIHAKLPRTIPLGILPNESITFLISKRFKENSNESEFKRKRGNLIFNLGLDIFLDSNKSIITSISPLFFISKSLRKLSDLNGTTICNIRQFGETQLRESFVPSSS